TLTLNNLQILQSGLTLGSLTIQSPVGAPLKIGSILGFDSVTVSLNNLSYVNGVTPSLSGSISLSATNVSIFPDLAFISGTAPSVTGSFAFDNTASKVLLSVSIPTFNVSIGQAFTVHL